MKLSKYIKQVKKSKGLTNTEIARRIGMTTGRIWQLENSYCRTSKLQQTIHMADLRKAVKHV